MSLPAFGALRVLDEPCAGGVDVEAEWMARSAATGTSGATLWFARQGLVAPRSYLRLPAWEAACAASAASGWPVRLRATGGGIVPQGPGVSNLSLVWCSGSTQPGGADAIYQALCAGLTAALARLGVVAVPQPVAGSFCDGRYNLAVAGRKLAGTAQAWRRVEGVAVVLAHALIILDGDPAALTDPANAFEIAAGSDRRYRTDALTSVARAWCDAHRRPAPPADLRRQVEAALAGSFAASMSSPNQP